MTETDEKLSFDTSKEERVQTTDNAPQHSADSLPQNHSEEVPTDGSIRRVRAVSPKKTLLGMGITLPAPTFSDSLPTEKTTAQSETEPQPLKPLRLPALRQKLALAKHANVPDDALHKVTLPTPKPLLEPISAVGYDDSFNNEPQAQAPQVDDDLESLPEIFIEEELEIIPEVFIDEEEEEELEVLEEVSVEEHLEDFPEVPVEESLDFISEIIPINDDFNNENDPPTIEITRHGEDDFEDEATQIGAGLFDFPEKHRAKTPEAFDDEHTQISDSLNFEVDQNPRPAAVDIEGERTEIASFDSIVAEDRTATPQTVATLAPAPNSPIHVAHDDDFNDEKTELYDSPFENDPICPKLTVLSGPALGMEFFVNKIRNSIGRGTNNTIVVPDSSMSRQHFEINQSLDESFVLRDLQAVNGTFLNGTRIVEADLFHGDRIEAGKTIIQFLIGSTAPQVSKNRRIIPATTVANAPVQIGGPQPTHSSNPIRSATDPRDPGRLATYVALGCAALCVPLIVLIVFVTPSEKESSAQQPMRIESGQTASQTYLAGVEAVKKREWIRARTLFLQTVELEPKFDGIPAQLTRIDHELAAMKLFEDAQTNIENKQREQALTKIRAISQNSVYFDDAQKLIRQIRQQEVFSIFDQARASFDQGEFDQSSQLLAELLEIVPEHVEGIELKARIEQLKKDELRRQDTANRAENAAPKSPAAALNTIDWANSANTDSTQPARARAGTASVQAPGNAPVINFTDGFSYYRNRNFDQAIAHFEQIASGSPGAIGQRAEKTVSNIRRFEMSFNNGQAAFEKSNWAEAARHFQEAHRADVSVGGASGYFSKEISEKLARAFGEMGIAALKNKQYQRAYTSLERGNAHSSQDPTLNQLARELTNHATSLYDQALKVKTSNPKQAATHCRTVLTMVSPSTPTYQNAKKLLDTL